MSEQEGMEVPAGFELIPTGLGFTDTIGPLYRRIDDDEVSFGLQVQSQHGNSMGICHGGVLMTLADVGAASAINHQRGIIAGSPTINLSFDFITAAKQGEWIEVQVQNVSVKRRFGFCSGLIVGPKGPVVRFNGTFYLPDHDGMWQDGVERPMALNAGR
jgi:uncharacterized protein (TIGR00369 family)